MRKPGVTAERQPSASFLTQEQREALDAALLKKRAEQPTAPAPAAAAAAPILGGGGSGEEGPGKPLLGKNPHSEGIRTKRDLQHDHHLNRKGKGTGRTKKSGAGGKYTWGAAMSGTERDEAALDPNDPNYDSGNDASRTVSFHEERSAQIAVFKRAVALLLEEYYNSGDLNEAAVSLQELDHPEFGHYFVKRALATALDKHDREREMTSLLLSTLYNEVIAPDQVRKGFLAAIEALEDLHLDVPGVVDLLALFICRAVADDVLPPSFIQRVDGPPGSLHAELRSKCGAHVGAKHIGERLQRCWGSGAGFKLDETKGSIRSMLQEYASSGDKGEVRRLLRDLAVPFFHHEFVKQALLLGMDAVSQEPFLVLLGELSETAEVSVSQMTKGFQRVADNLADTELDNPAAKERFDAAVKAAVAGGWIEEDFSGSPTSPSTPGAAAANGNGHHAAPFGPGVQAFKAAALNIVREYFDSGDAGEVATRLAELEEPGCLNVFVKHAVQLAMDRKDRERELVSALLPGLTPAVVPPEQAALGFTRLLAGLDDLALDIPEAPRLMELFLGRAIVDEVLPPRFLAEAVPHLEPDSLGIAVVQQTGTLLSARHAAERFDACWHGGVATIEALRGQMEALLKEYLSSGDFKEAVRCLQELSVPHFHHDFVARCLLAAFEQESDGGKILGLLKQLADGGDINQTQMAKGFARVESRLEDIALDSPRAPELYQQFKAQAAEGGWLVAAA